MHAIQAADAQGPTATSPPQGISIVYPTRDRPQFIAQSLTALLGNTVLPDEIVVVDQSRTDATRHVVEALESPLIVHVPSTEVGLSRARNTGIRSSRFPIIGFIDDDCIPARNWIASAKSVIERVPGSAVWVGKVFYDERYITDEVIEASQETCHSLRGTHDPWRFRPAGGNSFFPRHTFDRVGYFDPLLGQGSEFPGAEDGDMVYRISKANLQVTYSDRVRLYHLNWRTEDDELGNAYNYGLGIGAVMAKHAARGDYYPATVIFGHFLPHYFLLPLYFLLGRRRKFRHSLNWSQSIVQGFFRWRRLHRSRSGSLRGIPRH